MEISLPLFNKILETNHLVKGRLNVKDSDLKKIYLALQKDDEILGNKLSHHEKLMRTQISKRNARHNRRAFTLIPTSTASPFSTWCPP